MIPTQPGWYWFRDRGREKWKPAEVVECDGRLVTTHVPVQWDIGYTRVDHFAAECWGPRIEEPPA